MPSPVRSWDAARARERGDARTRVGDEGAGSVLMIGVVGALLLLAAFVGLLGGSAAARGSAQAVADLAALAAADADMLGTGDPCARASAVAERNGGTLIGCDSEGEGVYTVTAGVGAPAGRTAHARARAGPESAAPWVSAPA